MSSKKPSACQCSYDAVFTLKPPHRIPQQLQPILQPPICTPNMQIIQSETDIQRSHAPAHVYGPSIHQACVNDNTHIHTCNPQIYFGSIIHQRSLREMMFSDTPRPRKCASCDREAFQPASAVRYDGAAGSIREEVNVTGGKQCKPPEFVGDFLIMASSITAAEP